MKKILIIGAVFFVLALIGTSWGWQEEATIETHQSALESLKNMRMKVAVELQILQVEAQEIVDRMKVLQAEARKLSPKIKKLQKEFMDLTDKINKK